jgi:hypothetical protein
MQALPHGAQLHKRADIPRLDRGSQDIRKTKQCGSAYETATLLRLSDYGPQDPRPTASHRGTSTPYPNTGRKSIAHRYGYIVSTAQRQKASTRRARRIYRRQASSNAPSAVPHSSSTGTDSGGRRTYTSHNRKQKLTAASMHITLSPIPHCTVTHDVSHTRTAMYKKPLR